MMQYTQSILKSSKNSKEVLTSLIESIPQTEVTSLSKKRNE